MKPLLFTIMLMILSVRSFSQETTSTLSLSKQDYLLKSKHQKTAAWVLLGGGLVLSTIGTVSAAPKALETANWGVMLLPSMIAGVRPEPQPKNDYTVESALFVGSAAAVISSITLFIASSKNKRKAMNLNFKNESALQPMKGSFVTRSIPSLSLKLSL